MKLAEKQNEVIKGSAYDLSTWKRLSNTKQVTTSTFNEKDYYRKLDKKQQ